MQAESYLQHAEHYYRIMMAAQAHQQAGHGQGYGGQMGGGGGDQPRPNGGEQGPQPPQQGGSAPSFSLADEDEDEEVA